MSLIYIIFIELIYFLGTCMSNVYQLIWFRQDLRIHDHAALWHASQQGPSLGFSHLIARAMETTRRCSNKNKFLFTTTQNASEKS